MRRVWVAAPILVVLGLTSSTGLIARAAPSAAGDPRNPVPLRGAALQAETGLRLLVADDPPFILDVDTDTVMPVPGIPALRPATLSVVAVGGRAGVVVARSASNSARLYAVRGRTARVSPLGIGTKVWSANDGKAVWVQSTTSRSRCSLRRMSLDGRRLRAPRAFPCATVSDPAAGSLGLVTRRTRVLDPRTGRLVLETRFGVVAAAGAKLVLAGPATTDGTSSHQFTLLDGATRVERRFPWPSLLLWLDAPAIDPVGRFVALAFADPAWGPYGQQGLDVWLLDTRTGGRTHLPGMPAFVSLKRTSMAWTDDGRLVLLGETNGREREFVAVWRPGQPRLALKTVHLPERSGGSDSFAILQ
ncbi:MAG: hypothetical protein H0T10_03970 [Actinobacteria bacterium]|nr:hypothetical protein [Actinomycetota bacterium]